MRIAIWITPAAGPRAAGPVIPKSGLGLGLGLGEGRGLGWGLGYGPGVGIPVWVRMQAIGLAILRLAPRNLSIGVNGVLF